ncbi:unnamed protein product [Enterobius vermicularis]|uniref:N-acetyltransferase domain-containing protein n=1 Tax=Enterobius vermicularis TaxID=51028 RepID=A0A0N4UY28_ENTVE|nr:unnamed protein product [Enterobius vermicularis]
MRANEKIKLVGAKVVLVPYEQHHVKKYHDWLEDPELRRVTGSERLTLEEEYRMQKSWREDEDKCTFILLSRKLLDGGSDEVSSMIGDVNIFLADGIAELEIMVAETSFRGQGIGTEAAEMMIKYSVKFLHITKFQVKIVEDNISSIGLFKKLGFEIYSYSAVFKEHTLFLKANALEKIISGKCLKVELYGRGD